MTVRDYAALAGACELVAWDVAVRPRAHGQVGARARVGARQRPHQHRGLLGLPRGASSRARRSARCSRRARSTSSRRAAAAGRWTWCSTGRTAARCRSSRSPARARSRRATCCCRRSRSPGPGGHWVEVSRAICAGEPSDDTKRMLDAYEEYYDARARRAAARARPRATRTGRSRRASSTAASTSVT